jgi:UDPglucose--hexose-1-phosphate uridylyltransferase
MFTVREISSPGGIIQYRRETLTGISCRISPQRLARRIDQPVVPEYDSAGCPFCPDLITTSTPVFPDGNRIGVGESITFPNLFPFAARHTVTVITREHNPDTIPARAVADALEGQARSLRDYPGFSSINWNYLPSAGASMPHPHLQGIADEAPTALVRRYLEAGKRYHLKSGRSYWEVLKEKESGGERHLFGDELMWSANAVPLGEKEVRAVLPVRTLEEAEPYFDVLAAGITGVIALYRSLGSISFNMAIYFDRPGPESGFRSFCSMIARINPNALCTSDSAFMERLHVEPVILTLPEEFAARYHGLSSSRPEGA